MMTDYHPVDCGQHDEYELAIMRGRPLQLTHSSPDACIISETIIPTDLQTRQGEEFLVFMDETGQQREVRLDRIQGIDPA